MAYRARFIKSLLLNKEIKVVQNRQRQLLLLRPSSDFIGSGRGTGNNYNQGGQGNQRPISEEKRTYALLYNLEKGAVLRGALRHPKRGSSC